MKRKMPKVLLTLAVACMLVIGAVVGSMTMAYAEDTTVLPDDYIAHFTFDGTLADETGDYTATAVAKAFYGDADKTEEEWVYEDGTVGQAIVINDDGDLVGLNTGINITNGQSYSISFAAKADTYVFATPVIWIGSTDQSTEHWQGFWGGFGTSWQDAGFGSNDENGSRVGITPETILNNATNDGSITYNSFDWTVITWTYDATDNSVNLYYDGVLVGSATGVAELTDDAYIYIGANYWDNPACFAIDELYVYDYVIYEEEDPAITAIEVTELSTDEFTTGDELDLTGTKIQVTYEDGTFQTFTLGEDANYGAYDSYGNRIEYFLYSYVETYEEEGETYTVHDTHYHDSRLTSDGTYKVGFYVYDSDWNNRLGEFLTDTEVIVNLLSVYDITDVTELTLDKTYTTEIEEYGDCVWYSYTPSVSGYYVFESFDNTMDSYVEYYFVTDDGDMIYYGENDDDGDGNNFKLRAYLEEGRTYYFKTRAYGDYSVGIFYVELSETTVITAVSVSALSQTEFTQYAEYFDLTGTVVTVTYSDGTTADLTINESYATDDYGNTIRYYLSYLYEDEYESWWYTCGYGDSYVPEGTYVVTIYDTYTGACDETQSITVNSLADYEGLTEIELLDEAYEVTDVESSTNTWFSFTPEDTSYYYFVVEVNQEAEIPEDADYSDSYSYYSVYYLEDGERVYVSPAYDEDTWETLYDESGEYWLYALTEGVTYYIRVFYECGYQIYVEETDSYEWYDISADISVTAQELNHTHTYADKAVTWTWSDDYSTATAVLRCDTCSHTETATATGTAITSVTTAATATTDGSIVYTATVTINGVEYIGTKKVTIPATGETTPATTDPAATDPATTDPAATDPATTDPASTATNTSATPSSTGTAPKTSDVSTLGYYMLLLGAAAVIVVLAKKRVNA